MTDATKETEENPWLGRGLRGEAKMLARTVGRNADRILTYRERVHHQILPGGGVPETPMSRKERGGSRLPLTDAAVDIAEANAALTSVLGGILRPRNAPAGNLCNGEPAWRVLSALLFDATAVRTWRAEESDNRPQNMRACEELCRRMALVLATRQGNGYVLPRPVTSARTAAAVLAERGEQAKNPNREAPKVRKVTAHDSYRAIVRDMEAMVEDGDYSKEAAKWTKAEELGCSIWRVRDAIKFVNKERETLFSGYETDGDAA